MSIITAQIQGKTQYNNELFLLEVEHRVDSTLMRMDVLTPIVNTKYLPETIAILRSELPSILRSKCFNENHYPFRKEVKKTEIGHLFEHILLEYMSRIKIGLGKMDYVHNGVTDWNWDRDAVGVFHITVDAGLVDREIFDLALGKSMVLITKILQSSRLTTQLTAIYLPTTNYLPAER